MRRSAIFRRPVIRKMFSMDKLPEGILKFTGGQFDYYRTLIANSNKVGSGDLLYAGEFNFYNGVWQQPEDSKKFNGMLRYTLDKGNWGSSVFAKALYQQLDGNQSDSAGIG